MTANPLRASRGTTSSISARALLAGELAYNTTTNRLHAGDGTTLGGRVVGGSYVDAGDYGVGSSETTDYTDELQDAIDACSAAGGGRVKLRAGRIVFSETLTLPSKVILSGQGHKATELYLANGSNCTMIKTADYDDLIGTDTWLVADGMPHSGGIEGLRLNGNKANQSSGSGVQAYMKCMWVQDVMITSCKDEGWHSEGNYSIPGSPATNGDDNPEGIINGLHIWQCDSNGMVFRGQHDTSIQNLFIGMCGGWGLITDSSDASNYNGAADWGLVHVYANTAGGVSLGAPGKFRHLITESNFGEGLNVDATNVQISIAELYTNARTTGSYNAVVSSASSHIKIANLHIRDNGESVGGLQLLGDRCQIKLDCQGAASTGTGLAISGYSNRVSGDISGYSGTGGKGLLTGTAEQMIECTLDLNLTNNKTLWQNNSAGSLNHIFLTGDAATGQTTFSGTAPSATETCMVSLYNVDTNATKFICQMTMERAGAHSIRSIENSADARVGAFYHRRGSANRANNDKAALSVYMDDQAGTDREALSLVGVMTDAGSATPDSQAYVRVLVGGTPTNVMVIGQGLIAPLTAAGQSLGISSLPFGAIYFRPGASVTPANNGDVVFEATSNTSFTIKHKGSDGTVRSGSVTLS